ncbi:hypothetical protein MKW94_012405 [Papaver nudicaule]|uniref:Uncharacterized protein n=1 Tax=Papaver nudicaule TaxID=74823 RepID=A0AA41SFA4_PAPNU|nr:hypothetical protein [Papaver nudicaule]
MKKKMSAQSCIAAPVTSSRTSTNRHHSKGSSVRDFAVKEESAGRMKQRNVVDKWVLEEKKKKKGNDQKQNVDSNKVSLKKKPVSVPVDTHRYFHSTSSSSDSSSGGGFSSSETESVHGSKTATPSTKSFKSASSSFFVKPIRTRGSSTVHHSEKTDQILRSHPKSKTEEPESRSGGGNGKAKSRAMKIYNDLIKVKQPISPGGKISTFLNSLFTPKKSSNLVDHNDFPATTKSTFTRTAPQAAAPPVATPTCSSASSYSRSCLSKTPSLSNKQRSVRFYPVNIIVDQESKHPREQSNRHHYHQRNRNSEEEFKNKISTIKSNPRFLVEEVIDIDRLLTRNYQRNDGDLKVEEDDYDNDRASYASSDLFELDNLSTIGLGENPARFSEELPVYETTHFETNRAIANGFRL